MRLWRQSRHATAHLQTGIPVSAISVLFTWDWFLNKPHTVVYKMLYALTTSVCSQESKVKNTIT